MKKVVNIEDFKKLNYGDILVYIGEGYSLSSFTKNKAYPIKAFYDNKYGVVLINDNNSQSYINKAIVCSNFKLVVYEEGDDVNHPSHYSYLKEKCGIEVIDITRHLDFDLGNAVKYILRAGRKPIKSENKSDFHAGAIKDLKKAVWYLNDKIKMLEGNGE